jgi:hypothetical protein
MWIMAVPFQAHNYIVDTIIMEQYNFQLNTIINR